MESCHQAQTWSSGHLSAAVLLWEAGWWRPHALACGCRWGQKASQHLGWTYMCGKLDPWLGISGCQRVLEPSCTLSQPVQGGNGEALDFGDITMETGLKPWREAGRGGCHRTDRPRTLGGSKICATCENEARPPHVPM